MYYYYIFSVISVIVYYFFRSSSLFFIIIGFLMFLGLLPSTGFDYDHYKKVFDNAYVINDFPWFYTNTDMTAEPLYLWYASFWGVLLPFGFTSFLQINFLLCLFISVLSFMHMKPKILSLFWLSWLPVISPTLFYASPRSSISFFLVFYGMFLTIRAKMAAALLSIIIGFSVHSQYIPISITIVIYVFLENMNYNPLVKRAIYVLLGIFVIPILFNPSLLQSVLEWILLISPDNSVAISKLHYIEDAASGFRATSLLSIVVYPVCAFFLHVKSKHKPIFFDNRVYDAKFISLMLVVVLFGSLINIIFFNTPHISGRIGRFSDYLGMGIVLPMYFLSYFGETTLLIVFFIFSLLAPILYPTLYSPENYL